MLDLSSALSPAGRRRASATGRAFVALGVAALALGSPVGAFADPKDPAGDGHKVTLCHATTSDTNPYVVITIDVDGGLDGHDGHTGPVWGPDLKGGGGKPTQWGDIIPPFTADKQQPVVNYPGLNYDAVGKAFLANDCNKPAATLSVVKVVDADGNGSYAHSETATAVGSDAAFKVTVTNTSVLPVVLDTITDVVAGTPVPVTCASAFLGTTLAAGASATCAFTLTGYSPADGASKPNVATVTGHQVGNDKDVATAKDDAVVLTVVPPVVVPGTPDLSIVKTTAATGLQPGQTVAYALTVTNIGNATAPSVVVDDVVPAKTTLVSVTAPAFTCTAGVVHCVLNAPLAQAGTAVVNVVLQLAADFPAGNLVNTGTVGPTDATPANNTSTVTTPVTVPVVPVVPVTPVVPVVPVVPVTPVQPGTPPVVPGEGGPPAVTPGNPSVPSNPGTPAVTPGTPAVTPGTPPADTPQAGAGSGAVDVPVTPTTTPDAETPEAEQPEEFTGGEGTLTPTDEVITLGGGEALPRTGAPLGGLTGTASLLLAAGVALVLVARPRARHSR